MTSSEQDLTFAVETIQNGGLVGFPTETVYGLGANALDPVAVAGNFELKQRPRFDPLIVHIADARQLTELVLVAAVPAKAQALMQHFWPGPLSLVLKKSARIPDIVTAGLPSVAIRCPRHEVAQALIRASGVPIAAPSANRFGMVSPTTAAHVVEQFGQRLACVIDGGSCQVGIESTVVSFGETDEVSPVILRPGGVTMEEIEEVIGSVDLQTQSEARPTSPGQLSSHYATVTPIEISDHDDYNSERRRGLLSLQAPRSTEGFVAIEVLSEQGCLREAAVNLFAAMRRLDELGLDVIIARSVPEVDLGRAIMDRIRRAASQ